MDPYKSSSLSDDSDKSRRRDKIKHKTLSEKPCHRQAFPPEVLLNVDAGEKRRMMQFGKSIPKVNLNPNQLGSPLDETSLLFTLRADKEAIEKWITHLKDLHRCKVEESVSRYQERSDSDPDKQRFERLCAQERIGILSNIETENKKLEDLRGKIDELQGKRQMIVEWQEESRRERTYLRAAHLHVVDRERSALSLLMVHNETSSRGGTTIGKMWEYAICANDFGCGKSAFAENYIRIISQLDKEVTASLEVFPLLSKAVTLHIVLSESAVSWEGGITGQILDLLRYEIRKKASRFVEFSTSPRTLEFFLRSLVARSSRPIFLVIDEVAAPFFHPDYISNKIQKVQTGRFRAFLRDVILPILQIEGLFLLLCGKAPFLDWLGTRLNESPIIGAASAAKTRRIVLHMIRPDRIIRILEETLFKIGEAEFTLQDFLHLKGPSEAETTKLITEYASNLYHISGGHPRTMCEILLARCTEIEAKAVLPSERPFFVTHQEGILSSDACELLEQTVRKFPTEARFLLENCDGQPKKLDISTCIGKITYEHLLPPLRIGLEELGEPNTIRLFIPNRVRLFLNSFLSPLTEYLTILETLPSVPIDFPFAFELLLAKIFHHFFLSPRRPRDANSAFFSSPVFGSWENFSCDLSTKKFPKVTARSSKRDSRGYTISPGSARYVVEKSFNELPSNGLWLLPRAMSSSPDLLHISKSSSGKRILCVAAKNYSAGSSLGTRDVDEEVIKADRMIPDNTESAVLFIACTSYDSNIEINFKGSGFCVYPRKTTCKLTEIILLNLTSPFLRGKFCGQEEAEGIPGFEILIRKAQSEFGLNYVLDDT